MINSTFYMKNANLKNAYINFLSSINKVSKTNNKVDLSKEEVIILKLEAKLGKSKEEVKNMISEDLLSLLSQVPFEKSYVK